MSTPHVFYRKKKQSDSDKEYEDLEDVLEDK